MTIIKKNKIILVFYVMAICFTYALMFRVDNLKTNNVFVDNNNTDVVLINPE